MAQQMMSVHPDLQQQYYRIGAQTPQSCETETAKVTTIRKLVEELKNSRDEMLRERRWDSFMNKGLLVATMIRDTCKVSLQVITSVGGALPGKAGMKIELLGTGAVAMIDLSGAVTESVMSGDWEGTKKVGLGAANSFLNTEAVGSTAKVFKAPAVKNFSYAVTQGLNASDGASASQAGDTRNANQSVRNMGYDAFSYGISELDDPVSKKIRLATSLVKDADNYATSVISAIDVYYQNKDTSETSINNIKTMMNKSVSQAEGALRKAVVELEGCLAA